MCIHTRIYIVTRKSCIADRIANESISKTLWSPKIITRVKPSVGTSEPWWVLQMWYYMLPRNLFGSFPRHVSQYLFFSSLKDSAILFFLYSYSKKMVQEWPFFFS